MISKRSGQTHGRLLVASEHVVGDVAEVVAHEGLGGFGVAFGEGGDDGGVLLVVVLAALRGGGTAFEASPHWQGPGSAHDVEQVHKQTVVDGLGDGPVQVGVVALEGFVAVAVPTGVQVSGDAVEVGLVGGAGGERGDGRLDGEPDLHDLGGAGVRGRPVEMVGGGLGEEGAAADVAGDE